MFIGPDNDFVGGRLTISEAKSSHSFADLRLFTALVKVGLKYGKLRPKFVNLGFRSLNPPNQPFGIMIQANVKNEKEGNPQNAVDMLDGPGVVFAEKPV
jgi:hypothetical protein